MHVTQNKTPEVDQYVIPGIFVESEIEDITIMLGQDQFSDLLDIVAGISIAAVRNYFIVNVSFQ